MIPLPPPPPPIPEKRKPGRPRGSRNKASILRDQSLLAAMGAVAFGDVEDSLDLLRAVMRSPSVPLQDRLRCAFALAPFDAPKVAPVPPPPAPNATLAQRLEEAFRRTGRGPAPAPLGLTPEEQAELEAMLR